MVETIEVKVGDVMYKNQFKQLFKRGQINPEIIVEHWESLSWFNRTFRQPRKYNLQYMAAKEYLEEQEK